MMNFDYTYDYDGETFSGEVLMTRAHKVTIKFHVEDNDITWLELNDHEFTDLEDDELHGILISFGAAFNNKVMTLYALLKDAQARLEEYRDESVAEYEENLENEHFLSSPYLTGRI